jgi:hypothetical protein
MALKTINSLPLDPSNSSKTNGAPQRIAADLELTGLYNRVPLEQRLLQADVKIVSIRSKVLQVIRHGMPVTSLFKPELKLNLNSFIKDQILIRTIADFIGAFLKKGFVTPDMMRIYFENSYLLADIQALFETRTPLLKFLYEACADVLNQTTHSTQIQAAIEGRIFTLKNALLAQQNSALICQNQRDHHIPVQNISQIKKEGADFLRYSLSLHLNAIKRKVESFSFQESLTTIAGQLIPFVQKVTYMYFKGYGAAYRTSNILTFRNGSGYNRHGLVAAVVMEACLSTLGYKTRVMERVDLEPKVTLATVHSVVEVIGPDQSKYLVDPTYVQFHRDVCLERDQLPVAPVLVLKESEVDDYIEKNIMVHWKANFKQVQAGNAAVIQKLSEQDRLISFEIKKYESYLPKERIPSDVEEWVRKSFKRVWELSTYTSPACVRVFQEIFNGTEKIKYVFENIKSMDISSTTSYLSYSEIERNLNHLQGLDLTEKLPLMAQLPDEKQRSYFSLLDIDPRLGEEVSLKLNAYFRSLRKVVNRDGANLRVIYGCAGNDCTSILLATDASDFIFVDTTVISLHKLKEALKLLSSTSESSRQKVFQMLDECFFTGRQYFMGCVSDTENGKHLMAAVELKLLYELRQIGVDLDQLVFNSSEKGIKIEFLWQYHGAVRCRKRSLTFITADITKPNSYPPILKKRLKDGIDIFYLKGACAVPELYSHFLPTIAQSISPGGWLMTTDMTVGMNIVDPEPSLKDNKFAFTRIKAEESRLLEPLMWPPLCPLSPIPSLDIFHGDNRFRRGVGTDITYWAILNLRQKTHKL